MNENAPQQDWNPRICNERSGFLFQHDCNSLPDSQCAGCAKPICESHTHFLDNEPFCTSCAKRDVKQRRQESQESRRRRVHYEEYDDPYFYGDTYYRAYGRYRPGYWGYSHYSTWGGGHHDHDFTSGDAESLMHEGDGDYEMDMGES